VGRPPRTVGRSSIRSAIRGPCHCVLRRGQGLPPLSPVPLSSLAALFLRCALDKFSFTKPNTSCTIEMPASPRSEGVRVHPGMPFGLRNHVRLRRNPHLGAFLAAFAFLAGLRVRLGAASCAGLLIALELTVCFRSLLCRLPFAVATFITRVGRNSKWNPRRSGGEENAGADKSQSAGWIPLFYRPDKTLGRENVARAPRPMSFRAKLAEQLTKLRIRSQALQLRIALG
jgi:hypothetical protein